MVNLEQVLQRVANSQLDPMWRRTYKEEDGKLYHQQEQVNRNLILERNQELRKDQVQNDLSFGRQVASIPEEDWCKLIRKYPELIHGDSDTKNKIMMKILSDPENKHFLVRDHV